MPNFRSLAALGAFLVTLVVPAFAQTVWIPRNPVTSQTNLTGIAWTGSQLVAVGDGGAIVTSPDGVNWTTRNSGTTNTLYAVAKDGGTGASSRVVAVGVSGTIRLSTNGGNNWTAATSTGDVMYAVTWAGNRFVAVGAGGKILTSSDGATWTAATSPATQDLNAVAWNGSLLMAVGTGGAAYTSADGLSWESRPTGVGTTWYSVTWAGGLFVAVGQSGAARTTTDGTTWTARTSNAGSLFAVTQGSKLVAVGNAGNITSSSDGITWTLRTPALTASRLQSVTWMGTQFVAVGQNGVILTSPDGDTWTQTSSSRAIINGVTYTGTQYVAVGENGAILTSVNGTTWLARASGTTSTLNAAASSGTRIVVVGVAGAIRTSEDGITWTARTSSATGTLSSVIWTGTEFLAVSSSGPVIASADGLSWSSRSAAGGNFLSIAQTSLVGGYVAVGNNGAGGPLIRTSSTTSAGMSWSTRNSNAAGTNVLNGVAASNNIVVAVGAGGTIVTSPTGATWTAATSGVTTPLYAVTWTGSVFVVVGAGGVVLTSPNGTTWTLQDAGVTTPLYNVHWSGSLVVAAGATGTILTSSPAALPPVPTQSTPSAGETAVPVNPFFSWSASGGAANYTVHVATTAGFVDTLIDSTVTGTSLLHGPLAAGTQHFWRVRANGGSGSSDWSVPAGFTTTPGPSSAPILVAPAANATDIPVSTTISWNEYAGATSYRVQVSAAPDFASLLVNDSVSGTSRILGGLSNSTTYHWRVYARLPSGVTAWSTARQFTTTAPPPPTPVLATPANGAIAVPLSATLTWNASAGASGYRVQVATASDFSVIFKDSIVAGATTMTLPGLAVNGVYYWRVRAQNAAGNSAFSAGRNFTTATSVPPVPAPTAPNPGALDVSVYTALAWAPSEGAVTYHLQLSTSSTFATTLVDDATLTGTTYVPAAPLAQTTTYYWRLSATNPVGTSAFSATRSFTTGLAPTAPPAPPALLSPTQFAGNVAVSPTLVWNPSATATEYHVQLSTSSGFETLVAEDSLAGTSLPVGPLAGSTSYYWRVRAINQLGAGEWSISNVFATVAIVPAAPTLIAPEQYATGIAVSPTLSWSPVTGATGYRVQVSTNFNFTSFVLNDSVTTTSRALGPLLENANYYWRVYAANAAGASNWSVTNLFTTGTAPIPDVPVLLAPAPFADSVPRTGVILTWAAVTGAMTYRVQLSTSSSFGTTVIDDSLGTSPARATGPLDANTIYYWRVRAKNNTGVSEFSLPNRFTTDGPVSVLMDRVVVSGAGLGGDRALRFAMPRAGRVTVKAYDTRGNLVARVFDGPMPAGEHAIGLPPVLRSGVHVLDVSAGDYRAVVKTAP